MQFSNRFLQKYGTQDKFLEMKDIVDNTRMYLDKIDATNEDKELLLETLYGFKHTIGERANIDMEEIYPKLELLESVKNETYEAGCGFAGLTHSLMESPTSPVTITISDKYIGNEKDRNKILVHEYIHLLSAEYEFNNGMYSHMAGGLHSRAMDEAVTESVATEINNFLDYNTNNHHCKIEQREGELGNVAYSETNVSGYVYISQYSHMMEAIYGTEALYRNKFLNDFDIRNIYGEAHYNSIHESLNNIKDNVNAMEEHLHLENKFLSVIERNWDTKESYNFSEYLQDCQKYQKSAVYVIVNNEANEKTTIDVLSNKQSFFEISKIYGPSHNITNEKLLLRELNPTTRSQDCYDFLIAMDGLKHLDKSYTTEELWDMKYKRVDIGNNSVIEVNVGDDKYHVRGEVNNATCLTTFKSIEKADENNDISRFGSLFNARFATKDNFHDITFDKIPITNKYSGIYDGLYNTYETVPKLFSDKDALTIMSAVTIKVNTNNLAYHAQQVDIADIKDSNNNNLFHILAKNDSLNAEDIVDTLNKINHNKVNILMNTPNNDGVTPMDMVHSFGNKFLLRSVYSNGIEDLSKTPIGGNSYIRNLGSFLSTECEILKTSNAGFINKMVDCGLNVNARDNNGDTIFHYYAQGKLDKLNMANAMNKGANINMLNQAGESPLSIAMGNLKVKETITLLKFGAQTNSIVDFVNKYKEGGSIANLSPEEQFNRNLILDKLIESNINLNTPKEVYGPSPLQVAAGLDTNPENSVIDYNLVKKLISKGADPFQSSKDCPSLRDYAAETGDTKLFKIMIEAGIDKNALDMKNSNLNFFSRKSLELTNQSVDSDLMEKISANQREIESARTVDLDIDFPNANDKVSTHEDDGISID